jgi:tRNA A-37 threonylcarbamoyl transferase component Bud32
MPTGMRFCGHCGAGLTGDPGHAVGAAVARDGRLSDSGALELKVLLVAETAGDYEILSELGRGGMAVVYKAREVHLNRVVAVKILPPDLTYARGATERFQREARTAAALDHPNIIPIYRISSGGRLFWYAMKFLEGRSLADILVEKGLLTVGETIAILEQVAGALDYAHHRGVVHRDVKPGNVMLDVHGRVTVTDFGIAKELTSTGLTGSGAIIGTPFYMSPEQCRGLAEISGASDQYSLGVMAYQMLTGNLPFDADSAIDIIHKHVSETPPPLETLLPSLPRQVINAVGRAMAKKPEDRFPTVAAFVAAMSGAPADRTLVMNGRQSRAAARSSGMDTPPALVGSMKRVAIGLVLVGGLAFGVWWLAIRSEEGPGAATRAPVSATNPRPAPGDGAAGVAAQPAGGAPTPTVGASQPPVRAPAKAPPLDSPRTSRAAHAQAPGARVPAPMPTAAAPSPASQRPAAAAGTVRISVAPVWANITIAGMPTISQKRVFVGPVNAGIHSVTFEHPGYHTFTRQITVHADRETALNVTMQPTGQP